MTLRALVAGTAAALAFTAATAETTATGTHDHATEEATTESGGLFTIAGVEFANPFNPDSWYDASENHSHDIELAEINPMDPDFWMSFIVPETHTLNHHRFTNPATYGEFMKPEFYMSMIDGEAWMKWLELDTYAPLVDLQTYAYWMQPGAALHIFDMSHYTQMAELDNYVSAFDAMVDGMTFFLPGAE